MTTNTLESLGSLKQELESFTETFQEMAPEDVQEMIFEHIKRLASSEITEMSLKEGDFAPDFLLPDINGQLVSSVDLRSKGPIVVIFFRGGWCEYCNTTLRMIRRYAPHFQARGASIVAISPQTVEHNKETAKQAGLSFPILTDDRNAYAQECHIAYQLEDAVRPIFQKANLPENQGNDSWVLPIPATYVIETDGRVTYSFVDVDFTKRAEPVDILNALPPLANTKKHKLKEKLKYELTKLQDTLSGTTMQAFFQSIEKLESCGIADKAIRGGDTAPDFRLQTAKGDVYDSKRLRRRGPLIVIFHQGTIFCEITLEAMQAVLSKYESKGATVIAISPQTPDAASHTATMSGATFPLLLDPDNDVAKKFRIAYELDQVLRNSPFGNQVANRTGKDAYMLPLYATYVIDSDGCVLHSYVSCDPVRRVEPTRVLSALPSKPSSPRRKRRRFSLKLGRWLPFPVPAVRAR